MLPLSHSKLCGASQVAIIPNCSILAAVGQKMASTPGVSATLFNALAKVRKLCLSYCYELWQDTEFVRVFGIFCYFFSLVYDQTCYYKQANINVRAIAQGCSEYNITVVLKREDCVKALRAVHSRFYLSRTTIAMGIIGPGLIGSTLLDQLRDQVQFP